MVACVTALEGLGLRRSLGYLDQTHGYTFGTLVLTSELCFKASKWWRWITITYKTNPHLIGWRDHSMRYVVTTESPYYMPKLIPDPFAYFHVVVNTVILVVFGVFKIKSIEFQVDFFTSRHYKMPCTRLTAWVLGWVLWTCETTAWRVEPVVTIAWHIEYNRLFRIKQWKTEHILAK